MLTTGGQLLTDITPSFVPTTNFGQMAQEKKSFLDKLAEIAEKAENVATVLKAPVGTSVTYQPPSTFGGGTLNIGEKSIFKNPLFLAGAAVVAVMLLRRK